MSTSSTRRLEDVNASEEQKPSKPLTPIPISSIGTRPLLQKSHPGKENRRPGYRSSGSTQKPVLRSVPRVEKSIVCGSGGVDTVKRSTSSVPRGRSPSPSNLTRVLPESRREKGSRVSGEKGESGSDTKAGIKSTGVKRVGNDNKVRDTSCKSSRVCQETGEERKIRTSLSSDPLKGSISEGSKAARGSVSDTKRHSLSGFGGRSKAASNSSSKIEKVGKHTNLVSRRKSLDNYGKALETFKKKGTGAGSSGYTNKNPSNVHEKLAFLEEKVKKIASDIRKTKDMLNLNNPDASKVILSDIQEKILGIEKAMSNVVNDTDDKHSSPRIGSSEKQEESENDENINAPAKGKASVEGLNSEDLEDTLFPRTQHEMSSEGSESCDMLNLVETVKETKAEINPLDPAEEKEIATEFLSSLDKEKGKVTSRSHQSEPKNLEVQEMDAEMMSRNLKTLEESDNENREEMDVEQIEDDYMFQMNEIGSKIATGGWFVSDGEAVILSHDDGSCSYYDIANCEVKSEYNPPSGISPNIWRDCWMVRAAGADGCLGRYILAASAGNALESGFCLWDFYTKEIKAFHIEEESKRANSRRVLAPLSNNTSHGCSSKSETQQWWYRPCGPLLSSTGSSQRVVKVFDIRDGEEIMRWELQKPVSAIDYSSPLQWRNQGKVVVAETEAISVWDVNSQYPEAQQTISTSGRKISAFHINNTDAEVGGGFRKRVSSSEAEGNDGVFCTTDSINILDFRIPSGICAKIPKIGVDAQCVSSRGDSIFLGCIDSRSSHLASQVQKFSIRTQRLVSKYSLPESRSHSHHSAITQVWGTSNTVMAISGMGLFVYDSTEDETEQPQQVKETIGPDDMCSPSFDYSCGCVLLVSRDRPALWRYLL